MTEGAPPPQLTPRRRGRDADDSSLKPPRRLHSADAEPYRNDRKENLLDTQKAARLFGWLFIATFITSIPARSCFCVNGLGASWNDMRFIPGEVSETSLYIGAILEFGLIIMNIATAVVLYPIVRRLSERLALGYVAARIMESAFILVGLLSIISVVSVNDAGRSDSGAEAASLTAQGGVLVSIYDWAFLFGPGLVVEFRERVDLGLPDVSLGSCTSPHGYDWADRRTDVDPLVRAHPIRGLRERDRARRPHGIAGDRLGSIAGHLRGMERILAEPDHEDGGSPG